MDVLIDEVEPELVATQPDRDATFADAVAEWRAWAEHTKRLKPATLRNYDALLSAAGERPRGGGTAPRTDHACIRGPDDRIDNDRPSSSASCAGLTAKGYREGASTRTGRR